MIIQEDYKNSQEAIVQISKLLEKRETTLTNLKERPLYQPFWNVLEPGEAFKRRGAGHHPGSSRHGFAGRFRCDRGPVAHGGTHPADVQVRQA